MINERGGYVMNTDVVEVVAKELFMAERSKTAVNKFVDLYPELDERLAYEVQAQLIKMKIEAENTQQVGWKLGLTSKVKQQMMGVHEPSYGVLLDSMQSYEGEPISVASFIHAKAEPEIAFVFDKELNSPHVSVANVLDATAYIAPAIEIIDSRFYGFKFTLADAISDNSSSSKFIIGERFYRPEAIDLKLMGFVYRQNGEVVSTGTGAAVMGHPARAIAWFAEKLHEIGKNIKPGQVVFSGSLSEAVEIRPGDTFTASFGGIGSVHASFTE